MSDKNDLNRIADAVEGIRDILKELVERPLPLRTAEKRLEKAVEVNDKISNESVKEVTEPSEPSAPKKKSNKKESVVEVVKTKTSDIVEGVRIQIHTDDDKNSLIGTVTKRSRRWATITVENSNPDYRKGATVTVSAGSCKILAGDENVSGADEVVDEEVEVKQNSQLIIDENDTGHPGNFRMTTGAHPGKTIHNLYLEGEEGKGFLEYIAFRSDRKDIDDWREASKKYLALYDITGDE